MFEARIPVSEALSLTASERVPVIVIANTSTAQALLLEHSPRPLHVLIHFLFTTNLCGRDIIFIPILQKRKLETRKSKQVTLCY